MLNYEYVGLTVKNEAQTCLAPLVTSKSQKDTNTPSSLVWCEGRVGRTGRDWLGWDSAQGGGRRTVSSLGENARIPNSDIADSRFGGTAVQTVTPYTALQANALAHPLKPVETRFRATCRQDRLSLVLSTTG